MTPRSRVSLPPHNNPPESKIPLSPPLNLIHKLHRATTMTQISTHRDETRETLGIETLGYNQGTKSSHPMLAPTPPQPPQLFRNKTSVKSDHSPSLLILEYINLPVRGHALRAFSRYCCVRRPPKRKAKVRVRGV